MGNKKDVMQDIIKNYKELECSIISQLKFHVQNHKPTIGTFREEVWKDLFRRIVPKKFSIEQSVFIIDSQGNVSNEVDLAIFDEQYTPYVFNHGKIKFIPIEAVAVVVECKSQTLSPKQLQGWIESIDCLETSELSIVRTVYDIHCPSYSKDKEKPRPLTQTNTRPIKILCCTKKYSNENLTFDFILSVTKGTLKVEQSLKKELTLASWYKELNHSRFKDLKKKRKDFDENSACYEMKEIETKFLKKERLSRYKVVTEEYDVPILSLIFQLNQLLMLINNPMFFPHVAYVDGFKRALKRIIEKRKTKTKNWWRQ